MCYCLHYFAPFFLSQENNNNNKPFTFTLSKVSGKDGFQLDESQFPMVHKLCF